MMTEHDVHSKQRIDAAGLGTTYLVRGEETGGRFALLEHDLPPRSLAAPLHTHTHEDEFSYVVAGRVGVQVGEEVRIAGPGELVAKPRGIPHAFWNAGDEEARVVELVSPAGFEHYFEELPALLPPNLPEPDLAGLGALAARYGLAMDPDSIGPLVAEHGLRLGP